MADEQFYTILTNVGKAKVANAALLSSNVTLKTLKVGDGNGAYYNPTEEQTELKNTVYTCNVGSVSIDKDNPNWIVAETIIPGSVGGFTIREVGLFDTEGDLIAIGKYPETYKPVVANGASKDLNVRTIFEVSNAANVNLSINPSVIIATKDDINNLQVQIDEHKEEYTELKEDVEQLSNPNLLINGGFDIWQRGKEFEFVDKKIYCADRWRMCKGDFDVGGRIYKNKNELVIKPTDISKNADYLLDQTLDNVENLKGKQLTFSIQCRAEAKVNMYIAITYVNSSNQTITLKYYTEDIENKKKQLFVTAQIAEDAVMVSVFVRAKFFGTSENDFVALSSAKLEIGDRATPFIPMKYELEEFACKKYYQGFKFIGRAVANNNLVIEMTYPCAMRIIPTLAIRSSIGKSNYISLITSAYGVSPDFGGIDIGSITQSTNIASTAIRNITFSKTGLTVGEWYCGLLVLDAEIY